MSVDATVAVLCSIIIIIIVCVFFGLYILLLLYYTHHRISISVCLSLLQGHGYLDLQVAYSEQDENRFIIDGYEKVIQDNGGDCNNNNDGDDGGDGDSFANYGLPDGRLFVSIAE